MIAMATLKTAKATNAMRTRASCGDSPPTSHRRFTRFIQCVCELLHRSLRLAELKNSSALHAAIINPDGVLILTPLVSGDEQSLTDFQSVALIALEIAATNSRHVTEHLVPGRRGGRLYDRIVIYPSSAS